MAGHSGYHVQQGGMDAEAKKLDSAGDDTGDIKAAIADAVCFDDDVLGGSDSGPAYRSFSTAWQQEAKTLESALHELADKVRASKGNYDQADHEVISQVGGAAGSGNPSWTTRPAPVTDRSPFG
ncbi:WXG100 family type VII secretion target [Streptomyces sp. CA2R101]|uniref:WXG100 family type VII secretion target n=1 Tax=Streptomyces sp. CA2R101 TaxID=3120152 RepID=UPI00300BD260